MDGLDGATGLVALLACSLVFCMAAAIAAVFARLLSTSFSATANSILLWLRKVFDSRKLPTVVWAKVPGSWEGGRRVAHESYIRAILKRGNVLA